MKKFITWLFADFLFSLYNLAEAKFTKGAISTPQFMLVARETDLFPDAIPTRALMGLVDADGIYDAIVEGDGNAGFPNTKVFIKPVINGLLASGKMSVIKRQMNTSQSDDTPLNSVDLTFMDFNATPPQAVLVHNFGRSENPIAFKVKVTEEFTYTPAP